MRCCSVPVLFVSVGLCNASFAADECCEAKFKATQGEVSALIKEWQAAAGKLAEMCPDERKALETEFAAVASSCPIGSRIGGTVAFVRDSLAASLEAQKAIEACCAGEKTAGKGEPAKDAACCEEGAALMAARAQLLKDLHSLASFASGAGCCAESKACEKGVEAAAKSSFCPEAAEKLAVSIRKTECEKACAEDLVKALPGLACEKKAAALVAQIKAAGCEKSAAEIIVKAASECCASEKAKGEVAAKAGFCPEAAQKLAVSIRKTECEKSCAEDLVKALPGLACEKKAAALVAQIKAAGCEKSAAEIIVKAASECCASEKAKGEVAAKAAGKECGVACGESTCCRDLALRATALKSSWTKAGEELVSMPADRRAELQSKAGNLFKRSPTASLLPRTVEGLAKGVAMLHGIDAHLQNMLKEKPDLAKSAPESVMKAFEVQVKLTAEAHGVLSQVESALKGCTGGVEVKAVKTTTL
jgi:hypothetical protein